ncbi:unnamed protein product [Plutella xylostella]|uniref:Odorant receptor n=1 Tax=Plutella xylostella TaxID=51655 RepID=A0A8S4ECS1_PLUXY|nr:unnamed protein product [Plutella xylostella]
MTIFGAFVAHFKDPKYPSMGFTVVYLKLIRLWQLKKVHYIVPCCICICFISQILYVLTSNRIVHFSLNMFQTGFFHLVFLKMAIYFSNLDKWMETLNWLSEVEIQQQKDDNLKPIVDRYIKYSNSVAWAFVIACYGTWLFNYGENVLMVIIQMETYHEIDPTYIWFFFLWPKDPLSGRWNVYPYILLQFLYAFCSVLYSVAFTSMCVSTMIAMAGQIEVLSEMFRRALDDGTEEEQYRNLISCYKRYVHILYIQNNLNDIMSPTLFIHLLVASINMSLIIFSLANSENISSAVYDSAWVDKSPRIRRLVYIMSSTVDKRIIFNAGPFNEVNVITYVQILKVTVSFYKLMCETSVPRS